MISRFEYAAAAYFRVAMPRFPSSLSIMR